MMKIEILYKKNGEITRFNDVDEIHLNTNGKIEVFKSQFYITSSNYSSFSIIIDGTEKALSKEYDIVKVW